MKFRITLVLFLCISCYLLLSETSLTKVGFHKGWLREYSEAQADSTLSKTTPTFYQKLAEQALKRTESKITYDSSYFKISYPMGDVPADKGVCTDVVIRSYRKLGIDLQQRVHQDMKHHFWKYPKIWRLTKPDTNIDHRRVPNLMVFFKRHGTVLPISKKALDYKPGDIVTWDLGGGVTHIGIVSDQKSKSQKGYQIVHNIGGGPRLEDVLFDWQVTGHFKYP